MTPDFLDSLRPIFCNNPLKSVSNPTQFSAKSLYLCIFKETICLHARQSTHSDAYFHFGTLLCLKCSFQERTVYSQWLYSLLEENVMHSYMYKYQYYHWHQTLSHFKQNLKISIHSITGGIPFTETPKWDLRIRSKITLVAFLCINYHIHSKVIFCLGLCNVISEKYCQCRLITYILKA